MSTTGTETQQQRARRYADMQIDGMTLDAIGALEGVTRERIRQVVERAGLAGEVRRIKAAKRAREAALRARTQAARRKFALQLKPGLLGATKYTDDDIVEALRVWLLAGGSGQAADWNAAGGAPSSALVSTRIGWSKAIAMARGATIIPERERRSDYVSEEDCLDALVDFLCDGNEPTGTYAAYDAWAKRNERPGGQTIRHRFGSWTEGKRRALEEFLHEAVH